MNSNVRKALLYTYTFLFIFNPSVFFNFNLLYILTGLAIILLPFERTSLFIFLKNKRIAFFFIFIFYISTYLIILNTQPNNDALYRVYIYILILFVFICSFFIIIQYEKLYKLKFDCFIKFLINIGIIQLFFVALTLLIPDFRNYILEASRFENLSKISNDYGGLRSFGFANGYTSTFPMLMGIFSTLIISYTIINFKPNLILINRTLLALFFLISVILNARIGIFPVILFLLLNFAFSLLHIKKTYYSFFILLLALIVFTLSSNFHLIDIDKYLERLTLGFDEIIQLFNGKATGTFSVLSEMIHIPADPFEQLFGTGMSVFGDQDNFEKSSDIGIVQDIYLFGIINTFALGIILIYLFYPLYKKLKMHFGFSLAFTIALTIPIYYLKGAIFAASETYNVLILLTLFIVYEKIKTNFYNDIDKI